MRCPFCGASDTNVKDSRPAESNSVVRRRRECSDCAGRFTTYERVQLRNLTVTKRGGATEEFDRDKLARSIQVALRKRNVDPDKVEQMISGIVRRLETSGESSVSSETIGEHVMQSLARVDNVAYVRFASVYKNFQDATDFNSFIQQLAPPQDHDD